MPRAPLLRCGVRYAHGHPTPPPHRRRPWILTLFVGAIAPWHRRADMGLGLLLHRPSQPGLLGAALDVLRVAAATRALGLALWSIIGECFGGNAGMC